MALRVSDVAEPVLLDLVRSLDERLQVYADEIDIRNTGPYVERAQVRFALGFPLNDVLDDFWMASRCLDGRADLHLLKHPLEKLRTRRIEPVELALLGGQTSIMLAVSEDFAFPIMPVLAHTASQEIRNEAAHCSSFFSIERLEGLRDLIGLAAAVWSAGLGAVIRGADDEANLALDVLRDAARAVGATGGPDEPPALVRYLRLARALRLLVERQGDDLPRLVADVVAGHQDTLAQAAAADPARWAKPAHAPSWLDTSTAAIIALSVLKAVPFDAAALPEQAAAYRELYEAMGAVDRSEEEAIQKAAAQLKFERAVHALEDTGLIERSTVAAPDTDVTAAAPAEDDPGGAER
jgi:hypothetical protein